MEWDFEYFSACAQNRFVLITSVWRELLLSLNYFLISAEYDSVDYKLNVNFSKSTAPDKLDCLFREDELD